MAINAEWHFNQANNDVKKLYEYAKGLEAKIEELQKPIGRFQRFYGVCLNEPYHYKPESDFFPKRLLEKAEKDYQDSIESAELNDEIFKENRRVANRLIEIMTNAGLVCSTTHYKSLRSRKPTKTVSGWYTDITSAVPNGGIGRKALDQRIESIRKMHADFNKKKEEEDARKEQERKAAEQKELKDRKRTAAIIKVATALGLDPLDTNLDINFLKEKLLSKDKYLRLASAGLAARNEFDKVYLVKEALDSFQIEREAEKEIVAEWLSCLDDYEDGRVFRDLEYNYNELFVYVNDQIMSLWNTLQEVE